MSAVTAFQAMSKTYKAAVTTSSQTITITPDGPCNQVIVTNTDATNEVYFLISNAANVTVTIPVAGTPQYCLVSLPKNSKVFTVPYQFSPSAPLYVAVIGGATSTCFFTAGEGL
jgi:hypothetical protein